MTNELTRQEQDRLSALELIIEKAWEAGGRALIEIQETRLYRKCGTFEEYCVSRWHKTGRAVRYLIESTIAVKELTDKIGNAFPISQKAARVYSSVPQELRPAVAEHIAHAHKPVTSVTVKDAEIVARKEKPVVEVDEEGNKIPAHAIPYWHRKQEVQDVLTTISRLRSELKKRMESRDNMWRMEGADQRLYAELGSVYQTVKNFLPYAVCVACGGWVANGSCDSCHDTGLVSEYYYKHCADQDAIAIRRKANGCHP